MTAVLLLLLVATSPSVENLLNGTIPGAAKVILHHPVLAVNAGEEFMKPFRLAAKGELGAPFVVLCEGSIMDEGMAAETGGYWSGLGADEDDNGDPQPIPSSSLGDENVRTCRGCCCGRYMCNMGRNPCCCKITLRIQQA